MPIIISANGAGATTYYEKPFSPLSLLKEIESLQRRSGVFPGA